MDDKLFNKLEKSIEEAGAHLRREDDLPEENVRFMLEPDSFSIRLNHKQFAIMLGGCKFICVNGHN